MILKNLFASLFLLFSVSAFGKISATRQVNEHYQQARTRHILQNILDVNTLDQDRSAYGMAGSFETMDYSEVTDLQTMEKLTEIFNYIRDTKFVDKQPGPLPSRRLSWLYPDDGCYTRAELASYFSNQQSMPDTFKFFSFGDLAVKTPNHPEGIVRWWYHVVPLYRVGQQAYVLDPSIDPRAPMTVQDWKKAQEMDSPVEKFAVCKPHTVSPDDNCVNPHGMAIGSLLSSQQEFLSAEYERVQDLGRDPNVELGDNPPWK